MNEHTHDNSRWIVGVDGSQSSRSAARWAAANAPGRAESLHLVQAWDNAAAFGASPFDLTAIADYLEERERTARDELASFTAELAGACSVPCTSALVHGAASAVLLDASRSAAQVVMGARGVGGFDRLLLGSTSSRCVTHATVPTVVVREHFDQPPPAARRLVVGFDGSDNAMHAVRWACAFALPGSTVDVVGAWEFTPSLFSGEPFYYPDAAKRAREHFDEQLDGVRTSARHEDVEVTTRLAQGRPRDVLAACAADTDLLVVGARGRGAVGAALLGSVSAWLLHHVDRPLAVIP